VAASSKRLALVALLLAGCVRTVPLELKSFKCGDGAAMRVHFYDVGQALAVLVELPTGELVMFDAGESPTRAGCGKVCAEWHERLLTQLSKDVAGRPVTLLWVSHPHSDHIGGLVGVLRNETVSVYADNGTGRESATVKAALAAVAEEGARVELASRGLPAEVLKANDGLSVVGITPNDLGAAHCKKNPNNCSVGLRIDYCASSVLLVGDAEDEEEAELDVGGAVTLLQVGHHGSETSSSTSFLGKVKPKWAVVSSGARDEGTNRTYCHPRAGAVTRLTEVMGDATGTVTAFTGTSCSQAQSSEWAETSSSSRLFFTTRDGRVTLVTTGDGKFVRER
jgi:competence protein ComEC